MKTMENQTSSTKQVALTYGLILGFVFVLVRVIQYASGTLYSSNLKLSMAISFANILAATFLVSYGISQFRKSNNGFLSFGEGLKTGIAIALIAGLIEVIYFFIFTHYIEPNFIMNKMQLQQEVMLKMNPNMSDEQINAALAMSKKLSSSIITSASMLFIDIFLGFIISLVATLVMKKNKEEIHSI